MRVLVVAPGRGSYGPRELGTLRRGPADPVEAVDAARAALGLGTVRALDEAASYGPDHVAAENASALIFAASVQDFALFPKDVVIAGVLGNSLGFYTALALSGALDLDDAALLVTGMAGLQSRFAKGAQVLYPVVDEEWREVDERRRAVMEAIETGAAYRSIDLGGFAVLAVQDPKGLRLPPLRQGGRDYPFVLEGHHGYHSPLVAATAEHARRELGGLSFSAPRFHLVDGRGAIFTPWSADPAELAAYALDHQVREPFDFTASVRTGLRELAPDAIVLLGPGESIGGAIGQIVVRERFQGISSKEEFQERQRREPVLYALGRADQRALFLGVRAP